MGITNILYVRLRICVCTATQTAFLKNLPPPPASEAVNVSTSNILMWEVLIWTDLHLGIPEQMSLEVPGDDPLIRVENVSFFSPPLSTAFRPKSHYPAAATGPASPTFAVIKTNTRQERREERSKEEEKRRQAPRWGWSDRQGVSQTGHTSSYMRCRSRPIKVQMICKDQVRCCRPLSRF